MTKPIIYMTSCLTLGDFFFVFDRGPATDARKFCCIYKNRQTVVFLVIGGLIYKREKVSKGKGRERERERVGNRRGMKKQKIVYFLQALAKELSKFP